MALSKVGKNQVDQSAELTVDSDLTVDTNTLYVDSTNNRVGISTSSPDAPLQINDSTTTSVGATSGDFTEQFRFYGNNGNHTHISQYTVREANGTDWTTSGSRLQTRVDSTYMGYMQFNGNGNGGGISFGTGTTTSSPLSISERMRVNSSGHVTMPYQPAFYAWGSGTQSWSGTSNTQTLVLANQKSLGSRSTGYNTGTSTFTAPIAGTYAFFGRMTQNTTATGPAMSLYKNGTAESNEFTIGYSTAFMTTTGFMFLNLAANDAINLRIINYNNSTVTIDRGRCAFAGWLIG